MMSLWLHRRAYSMIRIFRFLPRRSRTSGKYWILNSSLYYSITYSSTYTVYMIYTVHTHIYSRRSGAVRCDSTRRLHNCSQYIQRSEWHCKLAGLSVTQHPLRDHLPPPRSHGDSFRQYSVKLRVLALADLAAERLCKMWLLLLIMLRDCNNWWCPLECNGTDVWCK